MSAAPPFREALNGVGHELLALVTAVPPHPLSALAARAPHTPVPTPAHHIPRAIRVRRSPR
ncbi:hypothetical protein [Streptomyces tailanensis]|uniref:hypothetical protein n=1 Tax=Streptomyces tailanensis TaxID=2569858 RepID=UPI00122DDC5B|nr:hypothetical protein [Streptomyces tailanensis]